MSSSGESSDDGSEDESSGSSESSADEEDETSSVNGGNKDNEEMGEDGSKSGITIKTECTDDFDSVASNKSYNPDDSDLTESVKVKSENELNASTIPSVLSETVSKTDSKKPSPVKTKKRKRKQDTEKSGKKSKTEKRKKRVKKDSDETSRKNKFERRNIRKIIKENDLEEETKTAQQEEIERKKRLQEQQKKLMNNQCLKALLESSDEEIDVKPKDLQIKHHKFEKKPDVINISSDDEDVVPLSDVAEDEDDDNDDTENSGLHVDDTQNRPDESGLVLVNVGHPEDEPDIFLPPQLSRAVKPHQIGGVRFLYDNLVESLSRFKTSRGFGCILAHSMGLGKTIQVISFIDVFLRHTSAKSVLCIVPINTLQNWIHEFNVWLPTNSATGDQTNDVRPRNFELHTINDNQKNMEARAVVVDKWQRQGGVLLMGYEMYRLLATRKPQKPRKPKKNAGPIVIDLEEEDRNKELAIDMQVALLSPGPDLVICDEGHRIKNSGAGISKALKEIHTKRRVVLTGYPLQNNLVEYWCMVDFVRPNFLGTKLEFSNMFERPIMNAQCVDSTQQDLKVMRERAHVLHSLLEGFVQRRGHAVLKYTLPVKHECVIIVRMSDIQRALYKEFMNILTLELESWASMNPLKAFSVCCKIWNHPDVIYKFFNQRKGTDVENDLDIGDPDNDAGKKSKKQTKTKNKQTPKNATDLAVEAADSKMLPDESNSKRDTVITYDWATELLKDYIPGNLQNSGKFVILFEMIREILAFGDKLLIFSQSLMTLNLIEEYLGKTRVPVPGCVENWVRNKHYFRLDGSTSGIDREKLINMFNNPESTDLHLFLLSTKAGCLGINLIGANRVIIMDASWNPCHDAQAVCRIYRYGQTKPCHIYRLVTDNTLENKIYQRQVSKQTVADRVVDEMNPNNNFSRRQVDSLLEYEDKDMPSVDLADLPVIEDEVLSRVLFSVIGWLTKAPFNHESLLLDQKECKLTKAEKRLARQRYEREKKRNLTYQRPSYAAYYPTAAGHSATMRPNPMIANRRPYDAPLLHPTLPTPIPMQPHQKVRPPFLASQQLQNSGVSVHQVVTTTDIVMPGTNTSTDSGTPSRIPAGQQIMVIKTQKGVYIRTAEGRIFAVRSNKALLDQCQ
ncbi:helicase ARIP4-like [Tubulanus polymorphus]|uniref:helicase ARIP4-like n=1 Tax=Tubulanus polymorphus TaxID=672921 RepID=UPI003DA571BB